MKEKNIIQTNKKAYFDYEIISSLEVGIELYSYEIKQIVNKLCNIKGSFAKIINDEIFLFDMNIEKYPQAVFYIELDPKRSRRLLLKKKEIKNLHSEMKTNQHLTLVPLEIYINDNSKCKLLLGLCKGKKNYDKKETIKERDINRDISRDVDRN